MVLIQTYPFVPLTIVILAYALGAKDGSAYVLPPSQDFSQ